ncbi:MAG TPA: NfeD family protein, partial [Pyrinomonadaceae bacterium]|nr:NfeD family protein [Pyrinomonadaceae bacterium]
GLVFGGVVSAFGRFLVGQHTTSTDTDDALVGKTAQVTVTIKPGSVGQITARVGDERVERLARASADAEIAAGSLVTIKSIAGDSVIVAPEGTN